MLMTRSVSMRACFVAICAIAAMRVAFGERAPAPPKPDPTPRSIAFRPLTGPELGIESRSIPTPRGVRVTWCPRQDLCPR